jgi:hypothetical protein
LLSIRGRTSFNSVSAFTPTGLLSHVRLRGWSVPHLLLFLPSLMASVLLSVEGYSES